MLPFLKGAAFTASIFMVIGPQNAHVLRQGLKRHWVFATALTCSLCDLVLISLGVGGFGRLVSATPWLTLVTAWGGGLFLLAYALKAFYSATQTVPIAITEGPSSRDLGSAIAVTLGFSLLNPLVYLDTVILVGGLAGQFHEPDRAAFGLGAITAAAAWFFSLAYGASRLAPLFQRPQATRVLDASVGILNLGLAFSLLKSALR